MEAPLTEQKAHLRRGLLSNKIYMRVYTAYAAAEFGNWFDSLAIQVLVGYRWQAGPLMLALIPVSLALPGIVLGSVAGLAADRLNKLKLMRLCDLLTAVLTAAVLLAPGMLWLLPLLALRSAVSALNVPAQQSLTRSIVREDQLLQAASLNGFVTQGSKIAGPLLGGLALAALSPAWCIALNACMRLFSYVLLSIKNADANRSIGADTDVRKKAGDQASINTEPLSARTMWKEGWSFIFRSRLLRNTMLFGLLGALSIQMVDFQFASLFRALAPDREYLLGWLVSAAGAGAVLTIAVMNKAGRSAGYGSRLGGGYALIGAAIGGLGLLPPGVSPLPVLLLGLLLGAGNGMFMIAFNYCLQKETPPHMTGRVFGIQSMVLSAVMIAAPLLGGAMVDLAGPRRIFAGFGLVITLIGAAGMLLRHLLWPEGKEGRKAAEA
ncbi:MFS transporter [Paenibacillus sp. 7124]|uniref:MFS transporter n=1 Tax=Paenibacillus apii TaxID=1850370 RepID=A0A6M1PR28_9BACL|nr:MFS transporter [Paenibacillus apii]NGM82721.1 MFS transporter [Paenibacillus apii]NJJ39862.1 MFS transporter [Paenibacillus apii]